MPLMMRGEHDNSNAWFYAGFIRIHSGYFFLNSTAIRLNCFNFDTMEIIIFCLH